jgi:hypothetical protein
LTLYQDRHDCASGFSGKSGVWFGVAVAVAIQHSRIDEDWRNHFVLQPSGATQSQAKEPEAG